MFRNRALNLLELLTVLLASPSFGYGGQELVAGLGTKNFATILGSVVFIFVGFGPVFLILQKQRIFIGPSLPPWDIRN